MTPLCTRICPFPFFEATPPGAALGPPVKTGARVRRFRGCNLLAYQAEQNNTQLNCAQVATWPLAATHPPRASCLFEIFFNQNHLDVAQCSVQAAVLIAYWGLKETEPCQSHRVAPCRCALLLRVILRVSAGHAIAAESRFRLQAPRASPEGAHFPFYCELSKSELAVAAAALVRVVCRRLPLERRDPLGREPEVAKEPTGAQDICKCTSARSETCSLWHILASSSG